MIGEIRMGDVADFRNFMGAVIDRRAFERISGHLERAKRDPGVTVLAGGGADGSVGWFIQPTLLQVADPGYRLMCEEVFGPVLTRARVPGGALDRDARSGRPDQPLRAHRRGVRPGPGRPRRGGPCPA